MKNQIMAEAGALDKEPLDKEPLIEAKGVSVRFGGIDVLQSIDFSISAGEIVTIVGPNGSGKSTLLRTLVGAINPHTGQLTRKPGLVIGYVPQKLQIDHSLPLTVKRFLNLPRHQPDKKVSSALTTAGVPALAEQQMSQLSGGQFQRVLLARALIHTPDLLILDEATQGLDQPGSADFYQQIESVRNTLGCAVLMVSHELHVVMSATDRVVCLNGHICCQGTPEVVSSRPEYRALFGSGTGGALAIYRHEHDHTHGTGAVNSDHDHDHDHDHEHNPQRDHFGDDRT